MAEAIKVGLWPNLSIETAAGVAAELAAYLNGLGERPVASREVCAALGAGCDASDDPARDADVLVVIGGDGTILRAAAAAADYGTPLLGVNAGKLGYLANVERHGAVGALARVLNGEYATERRMMLEAAFDGRPPVPALNDLCASRAERGLSRFTIRVNGQYVDTYAADGVIVCTPTGSTAYNLSAGGPLLAPTAAMIAVTPVCPHTLYARPWVFADTDEIEVSAAGAAFHADGRPVHTAAETARVRRAKQTATLLRVNQPGFYDVLREKMIGGSHD